MVAASLVLGTAALTVIPASAASLPAPTMITASITTPYSGPCGLSTCYLVQVNQPGITLTITLSTIDSTGATVDAAFNQDTTVTLSASGGGTVTPKTVTMPRNQSTWTFTDVPLSYSAIANDVTIVASAGKGKASITSDPSNAFEVVEYLQSHDPADGLAWGTGPSNCDMADSTTQICAYVMLPRGANSAIVLTNTDCLQLANCTDQGKAVGKVSQVLTDIEGLGYDETHPATMIIKCYRTICGSKGVSAYHAYMSEDVTGPLTEAPACPAKGVLAAGQDYCVDYVQSSRVGVDDLWLYVLFDHDLRGTVN